MPLASSWLQGPLVSLCTPAASCYSGWRSGLCTVLSVADRIILPGIVLSPVKERVWLSRRRAFVAVVVGVSDPQNCITMPAVARREARKCAVHATSIADTTATGITSRLTRAIADWQRNRVAFRYLRRPLRFHFSVNSVVRANPPGGGRAATIHIDRRSVATGCRDWPMPEEEGAFECAS